VSDIFHLGCRLLDWAGQLNVGAFIIPETLGYPAIENLKCVALAVPEIIVIGVLFRVVNPNLGEEEV